MRMWHTCKEILAASTIVLAVFTTVHVVATVHGCAIDQSVKQAAYNEAVQLIDASRAQVNELQSVPDRTPEEEAALAKARATIDLLAAKLAAATDAEGNFDETKGLQVLTDFIPPPYNVISSLLIGSVGTWLKGAKARNSFKALVETLNKIKADDPAMKAALDKNKDKMIAELGPKIHATVMLGAKEGKFPVI